MDDKKREGQAPKEVSKRLLNKMDSNPATPLIKDDAKTVKTFFTTTQSISVYTVMRVLCRMRATLGLEAMLEYLDSYVSVIENNNPQLRGTVSLALGAMSIEKIYNEMVRSP